MAQNTMQKITLAAALSLACHGAFAQERREVGKFEARSQDLLGGELRAARTQSLFAPIMTFITSLGTLIVWWLGGFQVIDLSNPNSPSLVRTVGAGDFGNAHNICVDLGTGRIYVVGTNVGTPVYDAAANPANPPFLGNLNLGGQQSRYFHDMQVENGYAYGAMIYNGDLRIMDVSTGALPPPTLSDTPTPGNFTHNAFHLQTNAAVVLHHNAIAQRYEDFYQVLLDNPSKADTKIANQDLMDDHRPTDDMQTLLSPVSRRHIIEAACDLVSSAQSGVLISSPFGLDSQIIEAMGANSGNSPLRYAPITRSNSWRLSPSTRFLR